MKKTVCFIMVFVLMFVMTACGNSPTEDASSKPQDATGEPIGETAFSGNTFIINGAEYDYISYRSVDFEIHNGTIVLTYFIYNPGTDYADDIMCRYDSLLDRQYED